VPSGWVKQQGENSISYPGMRMDEYSHHEQKKRDLQVSKKGELNEAGGNKGRVGRKEMLLYTSAYVHSVVICYM
jgi:hypothetical protein